MSTQITAVYDAFVSTFTSVLPTYVQIPNVYDPGNNANLFLKRGYGVGIGPAVSTRNLRDLNCRMAIQRTVSVIMTRQLTASITDSTGIGSVVKDLLEDKYKIIESVEKNPTLGGAAVLAAFVSDGGIEYLTAGEAKYLLIEAQFDVEYFEAL